VGGSSVPALASARHMRNPSPGPGRSRARNSPDTESWTYGVWAFIVVSRVPRAATGPVGAADPTVAFVSSGRWWAVRVVRPSADMCINGAIGEMPHWLEGAGVVTVGLANHGVGNLDFALSITELPVWVNGCTDHRKDSPSEAVARVG
jgi:hypothetical protein